jgi:hypothetical protein
VLWYKIYMIGWKYVIYKLLAYRHLNNWNKLERYCDSHLKVVESRSYNSIQVQGCSIMKRL